jgi:hypothetical protein
LHRSELEDFTRERNKNRSFYKQTCYLLRFKANILKQNEYDWSNALWIFASLNANSCKQIFAWMWNSLKVLWLCVSKRIFWSKYLPVWEHVKRIFALKRYLLQHVFVLHQIEYVYANLCEYFEVNMK